MSAKDFLNKLEIPDRTITGRKPKGQIPEYRSSLIELLEEYAKQQINLSLGNVIKSGCDTMRHKMMVKGIYKECPDCKEKFKETDL